MSKPLSSSVDSPVRAASPGETKTRGEEPPPASPLRTIVHVCREYASLAGAGGVKDVTEGLSRALAARDVATHVFLPCYASIAEREPLPEPSYSFDVPMAYPYRPDRVERVEMRLLYLEPTLTVHLIDARRFRWLEEREWTIARQGIYVYTAEEARALARPELAGRGYVDFFAMNVLLVKASLLAMREMRLVPDVIHCHDGHAALLPVISQHGATADSPLARSATMLTIHNAGFGFHQDIADLYFAAAVCGVPRGVLDAGMLNGVFDPLLAGGLHASVVNTVSENYARELVATGGDAATGWLGHRLAGSGVTLHGVTNGIDPRPFEPERGEEIGLAASFSVRSERFEGKQQCKRVLLEQLSRGDAPHGTSLHGGVALRPDQPLLTFIGRLDRQKGFDVLEAAVARFFVRDPDVQLVGLGDGDQSIRDALIRLARHFSQRLCFVQGYSPTFANAVYAAGDFFIVPSRAEPCGLTDFIAQLFGNVPVVHAVGGLVKVVDGRFGLSYLGGPEDLAEALGRALALFRQPGQAELRRIQRDAVQNIGEHFTWDRVLEKKYLPLYAAAVARTQPALP